MNRSISKLFDEYQELTSQARNPSEYLVLKHDQNEVPNLPVDANLLFLSDKSMRARYFKILYIDQNTKSISKEFSYNLLIFYLYYSLIMIFNLVLSIFLYQDSKISSNFFIYHIVCTSFFLFLGYFFLLLLKTYAAVILFNRKFFMLFSLFIFIYLIIGSSQVFEGISSESMSSHLIPTLIEILGLIYCYRRLLFDCYRCIISTLLPILLLYLILNLIYSNVSVYTTLTEFSCFTLIAVMQVIESNSVENRTIQLFYRMEKEEQGIKNAPKKKFDSKFKEKTTTVESLENKCEFVLKEIKHAISVIIFRDVKDRLKNAQNELIKVKNRISSIEYPTDINQVAYGLDDEDKAFIAENYLKNSTLRIRPSSRSNGPGSRIINLKAELNQSTLIQIEDYLTKLGSEWNINPFYIEERTGKTFSVISIYVYKIAHLAEVFKISEDFFSSFFEILEKNYKMNPYHNAIHAADVFASLFYFYMNTELRQFSSQLDVACLLISALGHDVGHPGVTNRFLIASRDKIAIQYNDISVLENMHCSIIFSLLANENFDILTEISNEDWANCRSLIISMILDTDLSKHFEICVKFKAKASTGSGFDLRNLDDRMTVYSMALKCSDIGHSAKCKDLHLRWTGLVLEEFFMQGDLEKNLKLPVSMYCDRNNTDVPKSQAGFIKNICIPLYENWCFYLKSSAVDLCLKQLKDNFEYWDENYKSKKLSNIQRIE